MSDPLLTTLYTLLVTLFSNPIVGPIIVGALRSITGWAYNRLTGKTSDTFDPKIFGATMLKYTVAMNAIAALLPEGTPYSGAIVILADILSSWANKLKSGTL